MIHRRLAVALAVAAVLPVAGCGSSGAALARVPPNAPTAATGAVTTASDEYPVAAPAPVPVAAGGCNVNYRECVPNDVDVDCAGVPGQDGPRFVRGPIRVVGTDVYHLDGLDGDGLACEGSAR